MQTLRTPETEQIFTDYKASGALRTGCVLCTEIPFKTFTHWKIMRNNFPYDKIAKTHDMLLPIRHITEDELTPDELGELRKIKNNDTSEYNWILEATPTTKSIPQHFHLHLIAGRDEM